VVQLYTRHSVSLLTALSGKDLNNSKDGDCTTFLSNLFQYWITHVKKNLGRISLTAI